MLIVACVTLLGVDDAALDQEDADLVVILLLHGNIRVYSHLALRDAHVRPDSGAGGIFLRCLIHDLRKHLCQVQVTGVVDFHKIVRYACRESLDTVHVTALELGALPVRKSAL